MILGAIYLLYMFQKVFFGKLDKAKNGHLPDLDGRELATFIPLVIGIFLMGLFPRPFLNLMEKSVESFTTTQIQRLKEPDGPAHRYGADLTKSLDEVAKGAAAVDKAMQKLPATPPPLGAPGGAVPPVGAPGGAVPPAGAPGAVPPAGAPGAAPPAGAPVPAGGRP
ncbi:MAG: hypothetical protein H0V17_29465 [Deltaproteobacteria bacterium]|nr:hypothetical protein [Deltaproteobacteria bacterium]